MRSQCCRRVCMSVCLCVCVCVCVLSINVYCPNQLELISTACFTNPIHQPVCLYVNPAVIASQRLDINVTPVKNKHAAIE
jgi:hypothetical protein